MFDTISLFDNLEMDNTQRRVASRRALALAHTRIEHNLGRFLRGACSEADFLERLALVQDDFAGFVTTASAEVGHDNPNAIAAALKDHYRLAAKGVEFAETPAQKQEEEEEEEGKTATVGRWSNVTVLSGPGHTPFPVDPRHERAAPGLRHDPNAPQHGAPPVDLMEQAQGLSPEQFQHPDPMMDNEPGTMGPPAPGQWPPVQRGPLEEYLGPQGPQQQFASVEGKQGSPLGQPSPGGLYPPEDPSVVTEGGTFDRGFAQPGPQTPTPTDVTQLSDEAFQRILDDPTLSPHAKQMYMKERGSVPFDTSWDASNDPYAQEDQGYHGYPSGHMAAQNPADQNDNSSRLVTCPECGGDGKTAGATKCAKCNGAGKVPNFGDSMVDNVGADVKTSADDAKHDNTDLGGPEPKMDKGQGPGPKPDVPGNYVEKDIVEPIKADNEHPLKEIDGSEATGDKSTTETLPNNTGDAGFDGGGVESGPHTKTFNNDGQTDPVTNQALSSWPSPAAVTAALLGE